MQIIADLHLHSRFSRAVSPQMTIDGIFDWARKKGIGLVATGDWTHPLWMKEIGEKLEENGSGILKLKEKFDVGGEKLDADVRNLKLDQTNQDSHFQSQVPTSHFSRLISPLFLLSTEISCIFSQGGRCRRVHVLVWVPTIASAQKISKELTKRGCNLLSDGRPIIGLSLINLSELVLTIEPHALIVPAHIWTPWFSVYGKMGGFEHLDEAFGEFAKNIYAVETGLSSSPDMNWRIQELDTRSIVSFSDSHSGSKLGREATVIEMPEITYNNLRRALIGNENLDASSVPSSVSPLASSLRGSEAAQNFIPSRREDIKHPHIAYTIEFYPEEGKYHYTGHRECQVRLTPEEVVKKGATCSVCGKPLTQGVMQRVEELATSRQSSAFSFQKNVKWIKSGNEKKRPGFVMLVPLQEIIAEALGCPVASKKVQPHYDALTMKLDGEFNVLLHADLKEITKYSTVEIADGVRKVRSGDIVIDPGYDGVFGVVKIWKSEHEKSLVDGSKEQLGLF